MVVLAGAQRCMRNNTAATRIEMMLRRARPAREPLGVLYLSALALAFLWAGLFAVLLTPLSLLRSVIVGALAPLRRARSDR